VPPIHRQTKNRSGWHRIQPVAALRGRHHLPSFKRCHPSTTRQKNTWVTPYAARGRVNWAAPFAANRCHPDIARQKTEVSGTVCRTICRGRRLVGGTICPPFAELQSVPPIHYTSKKTWVAPYAARGRVKGKANRCHPYIARQKNRSGWHRLDFGSLMLSGWHRLKPIRWVAPIAVSNYCGFGKEVGATCAGQHVSTMCGGWQMGLKSARTES
jgi:hypothetical protein